GVPLDPHLAEATAAIGVERAGGIVGQTGDGGDADAPLADRPERAGDATRAAVPRVVREVDAPSATVGLPGRARRRCGSLARADEADTGDVGADGGQSGPIEAAERRVLAAAALGVAVAGDA